MPLSIFKSLIKEKCGLSFEDSREPILAKGIEARVSERALASPEEYFTVLAREPDEFSRLVNLITVNETYFFREPAHFSILTEQLLPEIIARANDRKIRIVCAGCSTGEEPYTIAMALLAKFGPDFHRMFSVVGFDIDEEAIGRARAGVYAAHSFRGVPEQIRKSYFDEQGTSCRIKEAVRENVELLRLNIFGDAYPDTVRNADVIFYRNVSIYFEPEAQERIFKNLAGLLNEKGYLFLSSSETFAHNIGVLSLVEKEGIFLYSKGFEVRIEERRKSLRNENTVSAQTPQRFTVKPAAGKPVVARIPTPVSTRSVAGGGAIVLNYAATRHNDEPHHLFDQALSLAEGKKYEDALKLAERVINMQPSFMKAYMLRAGILVNLKRFNEAEAVCRRGMERDRWGLEGHLMLGLITKIQGNLDEAKKRFKEAVYIKSSSWLAHFYLGEILRQEGEKELAGREYEIVIKLLEGKGPPEHGLTFFPFSFPIGQLVHLCKHNLAVMKVKKV